jgi:hypothetical protein
LDGVVVESLGVTPVIHEDRVIRLAGADESISMPLPHYPWGVPHSANSTGASAESQGN